MYNLINTNSKIGNFITYTTNTTNQINIHSIKPY